MIIQPPNIPAASGEMFGKTVGKNALEKGSRSSVGSKREIAAVGHCSAGTCRRRLSLRTSQATVPKLTAKRIAVPPTSPG